MLNGIGIIRKGLGISQMKFAELLNVTFNRVRRLESKRNVKKQLSIHEYQALCKIIGDEAKANELLETVYEFEIE